MKIELYSIIVLMLSVVFSCDGQNEEKNNWPSEALIMPEGISADSLPDPNSEGARLEAHYCIQCHGLPSPASHNATDWVPVLRRMVLMMERSGSMGMMGKGMMGRGRMGMMHPTEIPNSEEQVKLMTYLQAHSLKSITKENMPETGSEGASLFSSKCSRCHALPDPAQHTASEWPSVVSRMRQHLIQYKMNDLTDEQAKAITGYLGKNAAVTDNK